MLYDVYRILKYSLILFCELVLQVFFDHVWQIICRILNIMHEMGVKESILAQISSHWMLKNKTGCRLSPLPVKIRFLVN